MNKYVIIDYTYIYVAIIKIFSVLLLLLCLVNTQNWLYDTKRILLCFLSCILMPIIKKNTSKKKKMVSFHFLLVHIVSDEKSISIIIFLLLYIVIFFSLLLRFFPLFLAQKFNYSVLWCGSLYVYSF